MSTVLGDFGAALSSTLVYIGQKLGLYKAMAGADWMTPVPVFVGGGFYVIKAMLRAEPRITEAFKSGGGMRGVSMIRTSSAVRGAR